MSASKAARDAKRAAEGKPAKKTVAGKSKAGSTATSGTTTPQLDAEGQVIPETTESLNNAKRADEGASTNILIPRAFYASPSYTPTIILICI